MFQFPRASFSPRRRKSSHTAFSARFRATLALGLVGLLFAAPLSLPPSPRSAAVSAGASAPNVAESSQFAETHKHDGEDGVDRFLVEMVDGEATCRDATIEEAPIREPDPDNPGINVKDLPSARKPYSDFAHAQTQQGGDNVGSGGLTINLLALSQLQNEDPALRAEVIAAFERAAAVWTDRIKSPVSINLNIDYGPRQAGCTPPANNPTACDFGPNTLGSTGSFSQTIDYPGLRHNLLASASSAAETNIYNSLPTSVVPSDIGNGAVIRINRSNAMALGIPVANTNVATIGFNKAFPFDFNPDDGITPGMTDFNAVAVHEIGHALGFTSGVSDSSTSNMRVWDIFRFRPGTNPASIGTAQRVMSIGGPATHPDVNQVYITGQSFTYGSSSIATTELGVSTGGPSGATTNNGDGRQSSHWKDDRNLLTEYIGIMDPTIPGGQRKVVTENDFMVLETIGWNLTNGALPPLPPPPPAAPANDNFASAQALTGCSGSVTGTNVGATKEGAEPANPESPGSTKSVWYQWQAPSNGSVVIDTKNSSFDTVLAIYTGNALNSLSLVGSNDDIVGGQDTASQVTFNAVAGTVYRIEVNGFNNSGSAGDIGSFKLNWAQTCTSTPTVQFAQTSIGVNEAQGSINIIVTRAGDTSQPSTVKYQTSDTTDVNFQCNPATAGQVTGQASRKCDYHIASGRLRFAAGETSKQIAISIVNDVYVEGTENFTLTLTTPVGANLGVDVSMTLTITDNDAGSAANPIDNTHFFVRQLYVDLLSREPDPAGWNGWTDRINQCGQPGQAPPPCDRVTVGGDGFLRSGEFFDRQFFVLRLYRTGFGRILRYEEVGDLAYVSGFLTTTDLELNKQDLVAEIMTRTEFTNKYNGLSNSAFVAALLQTADVTVPSGVQSDWVAALNANTKTRAQVYREISERAEVSSKYLTEAQVVSAYYGFFTRNPDGAYLNFLQRLNSGEINLGDLANAFINAQEYRQRFGQ